MNGEEIFRTISQGGAAERRKMISQLAVAYLNTTNRTQEQQRLIEAPITTINEALSHPFEGNRLAKLWFQTVDVLMEALRSDEREAAGNVLVHIARAPKPADYETWKQSWPGLKQTFIEIMNKNGR